jgi:DNA-binding PadR family transcriptional regulator
VVVIELAVLGLLREHPRHGYELKQRCSEICGPLSGVSFGSLYPALRRLERAGAIEIVDTEAEDDGVVVTPLPATGSLSADLAAARRRRRPRPARRNRKAYRITDTGVEALQRLLVTDDDAGDDRTFALKLAFCRYLNGEERLALLQARRAHLASRLSRARRGMPPSRSLDRYMTSLLEHRNKATEFELAWIDQLIDEERTALAAERENQNKGAIA